MTGTNNKFITSQSFLSSDIIPTSSKEKENDKLLYTVRSLVMVRATSCQRKGLIPGEFPAFVWTKTANKKKKKKKKNGGRKEHLQPFLFRLDSRHTVDSRVEGHDFPPT